MLNYDHPPNWVRGRADCRLDLIFEALKQIIERDIAEFNKLESRKREGRKFELHVNDEGTMPILRVEQMGDPSGPSLGIEMSTVAIRINGGGLQIFLKPLWSEASSKCQLYINGKEGPYEVWEISQRALSGMFFG